MVAVVKLIVVPLTVIVSDVVSAPVARMVSVLAPPTSVVAEVMATGELRRLLTALEPTFATLT